jgi:hypothetical protein
VFDERDAALTAAIAAEGVRPVAGPTMMTGRAAEITLARHVLDAVR